MKKLTSKPGFEAIFSLSLFAILCLPPLVMAQTQKDIEIKIINGDTTINGRDIKKLNAQERADAMQEIGKMSTINFRQNGKDGQADIIVRRRKDLRGNNLLRESSNTDQLPKMNGNEDPASSPYKTDFYTNNDALEPNQPRVRLRRLSPADGNANRERRGGPGQFKTMEDRPMRIELDRAYRDNGPGNRPMRLRMSGSNVQNFDFENTDKDGISTHISFMVTDALPERGRPMAEAEKGRLILSDLSLSPEFSTGKTLLSFNLPAKATADVKLTDNQGTTLLAGKVLAGSFSKKVNIPLNGVYMLTVKQGAKSVTKRIVKEN
ncbi:T9SS type A sorting domain-containing protein [Mucilaginibacter glaciei]|uniref:T9SS type A sorting domain-containing protein n=1 Tax=Mucilaginibacter glaciei TaxID=2772109 RepID=A0A926S2K7_9SPHI|nr:T9SS type A sorting domain-containing protein [Mucilaginibacter glaciei]MBD1393957.1 T9SS type A sorting domain-containing protein [Mucilaginibacter glaciei]